MWVEKRIADLGMVITGSTPPTDNPLYWGEGMPFISPSDFQDGDMVVTRTERSLTRSGASSLTKLPKGTVLTTCIGSLGKMAISNFEKAVCNQQINALVCDEDNDPRFVFYCIKSNLHKLKALSGATTIPIVNKSSFGNIRVRVPSKSLQIAIADILDTLDTQIRQTEAIIAKLQLVKQGLLHDLLTRGIDANGQLRPPREQVPERYGRFTQGYFPTDWQEVPLGQLSEIVSGVTVGGNSSKGKMVDVPYLRVANVQDGYLELSDLKRISVSVAEKERYLLKYGDVLMNEGGDFDKLGRGTVWEAQVDECIHQNHVFRVRVDAGKLRPFFLAFWSGSQYGKKYFVLSSKQSTNLASINSTQLKAYPIMVPPICEQEVIEDRVNAINEKISANQLELEKLEKQKAGLMDDLLTGRVRVNELIERQLAS